MAYWDADRGVWVGDPGTLNGGGYHPNYNGQTGAPPQPAGLSGMAGAGPQDDANGWNSRDIHGNTMAAYGGRMGLSNQIAAQYGQQGQDYAHRQISDGYSSPYRMAQGQDRGQQQASLAMQMAAAQGHAPSAAYIRQGQGVDGGLAAQVGAAHSGGMFGGLTQANAQAGGARMGLQAVGQGSMSRAAELDAANRGYMGQASGMYGSDIGALSIDQQRELEQARLNQHAQLGSQGLANQVLLDQLRADSSGYDTRYGLEKGAATQNKIANDRMMQDLGVGAAGAGAGLASIYAQQPDNPDEGGY